MGKTSTYLAAVSFGAALFGASATADAASIQLKEKYRTMPIVGHNQEIEVYTLTVQEGDTPAKIVEQLNKRGLKHNTICGPCDVTIEDLIRNNRQQLLNYESTSVLPNGSQLEYRRVTATFPGFHWII